MKSVFLIRVFSLITIFLSIFIFSCQKEIGSSTNTESVTIQQAAVYSEESTVAEAGFDDADDIAQIAAEEEGNASELGINGRGFHPMFTELRGAIGDCARITVSPNDSTYPKTITINFGDSCVGRDGKLRSGSIVIQLSAPFRHPGSVVKVSLDNYFVNHIKLEGTKIFTNLSDSVTHKWSIQIRGGKVTFPSGKGYSFESLKTKTQVAGMDTRAVRDDVFEIEGRSKTEYNNGIIITLNTETPLVKKVICPWISNGKLKIKINDRILYLDYGYPEQGQCDNKALLSWNNGAEQKIIRL